MKSSSIVAIVVIVILVIIIGRVVIASRCMQVTQSRSRARKSKSSERRIAHAPNREERFPTEIASCVPKEIVTATVDFDDPRCSRSDKSRFVKKSAKSSSSSKSSTRSSTPSNSFDNFIGFWLKTTKDDFYNYSAMEFFRDTENVPSVKFYSGSIDKIKELQKSDFDMLTFLGANSLLTIPIYEELIDTCPVEVIDAKSITINNNLNNGYTVLDYSASTFKIQKDNDLAFVQLYTPWDGTGDDKAYGELENIARFQRAKKPVKVARRNTQTIASSDDLTGKWSNALELLTYIYKTSTKERHGEREGTPTPDQYIGNKAYKQLFHDLTHKGIKRENKLIMRKAAGKYIGIWTTRNDSGVTTFHLENRNYYPPGDLVTVTGLTGPYAALNGTHHVSEVHSSSAGDNYKKTHVYPGNKVHCIHLVVDSSDILDEYNPYLHGVGKFVAHHGPITAESNYQQFKGAVFELVTAFGNSTHTDARFIAKGDPNTEGIIDTFEELKQVINSNGARPSLRVNSRPVAAASVRPGIYLGVTDTNRTPNTDINDPTGLRDEIIAGNPDMLRGIDVENYLEAAYNMWFTITGPELPEADITSFLMDAGYTSNGSVVKFTVAPYGETPADLEDEFGTHPWMIYAGGALGDDAANGFVAGIVKSEYTQETTAYIRSINALGFDASYVALSALTFGQESMPYNKHISHELFAYAELFKVLNSYNPTKFIIDARMNGGGVGTWAKAIAHFFGANRRHITHSELAAVEDSKGPIRKDVNLNTAKIELVNKSYKMNNDANGLIDTDLVADHFPDAIVRGTSESPIKVNVLYDLNAASAGDMFHLGYIGNGKDHRDLGYNVTAKIVGDIDGRLYNGAAFYIAPTDYPNPYFVDGGEPTEDEMFQMAPVYGRMEDGIFGDIRNAQGEPIVNQTKSSRPAKLFPMWRDVVWQDLGLVPNQYPYPLTTKTEVPDFSDFSTWRDYAFEHAIVE